MDVNIGLFLSKRALLDRDRTAVIAGARRLTFHELDREANRLGHLLLKLGVRPGDRVAAMLRNGPNYVGLYYAAAKIGAVLCGLNWRQAALELGHVLAHSGARLLIFDPEFAALAAEAADRGGRPALLAAGAAAGDGASDLAAMAAGMPAEAPPSGADADSPLLLVYTSGTTGRAKGALLTHRQMFWVSSTIAFTHDYRRGDVHLLPVPMFHVGGMSFATVFVHAGATLAPLPAWDPDAVLRLIARERVNHFFAVPAMLRGLLDAPALATADITSLRWILSGGAPVPVELIGAYAERGIPVLQTYGATETAGPATAVDIAHALSKAGSIGLPYFHTSVRIADAQGREVEPGVVGELQVRSPHLTSGYWRDEKATAEAFVDGWLKTGDLGRRDEDGYIFLVDRVKDMIISGGENVYSAEVEAILGKHPDIAEVAVVGISDRKWGEAVCAVVVARAPHAPPTLEALRAFCDGKIARYKLPARLVISATPLPRNATGKVVKSSIRDWLKSAKVV